MTKTPEAAPEQKEPVQQLAELIDAYATAKAAGNETLIKIAVGPLQQFLNAVDVTPKAPVTEDTVSYNGTDSGSDEGEG